MKFFNCDIPIFSRKTLAIEWQNRAGVWYVRWQIKRFTLLSSFYTRHDVACFLWSVISAGIFLIAQFSQTSWLVQAYFASGFTLIGVLGMAYLTWYFTFIERLGLILYSWIVLMLIGTVITDLCFLLGWGTLLMNVCSLWLGAIGLGYLITGIGMRSRAILLCSLAHFVTIGFLPYVGTWQPLTTGAVVSSCSLLLAELQWDSEGVCNYQADLEVKQEKAIAPLS
jgi:hypothetical protein